jgi:hypothetical protein
MPPNDFVGLYNYSRHQGVDSATHEEATNSWVSTAFIIDLRGKHFIYTINAENSGETKMATTRPEAWTSSWVLLQVQQNWIKCLNVFQCI